MNKHGGASGCGRLDISKRKRSHVGQTDHDLQVIYIPTCCSEVLSMICIVQVQPWTRALDDADT